MSEDECEFNDLLISEIFEDYSPPKYEPYQDEEGKFKAPETATDSLIKFMKFVLTEIGGDKFNRFSSTFYLAKKSLGLKDQFHSFIFCTKYHKLYNRDRAPNRLGRVG
ncbi:14757_t:CDS:2, partial [Funneliformis geosporum]